MHRVNWIRLLPIILLTAFAAANVGCASHQKCTTCDTQRVYKTVQIALDQPIEPLDGERQPPKVPKSILVLSGGGMYGAYTAGFLSGWSKSGTRPQFDIVTGVSTGSLIAAVAFLGSGFDDAAREFYTSVRANDVYRGRTWVVIPFSSSVASSDPLKHLIESVVDRRFLERVAIEHRRGRRLYVGTTNLTTRKFVAWDMGAIANDGGPQSVERFRTVLLASCSVPGMLPAVPITEMRNGQYVSDLHVDGGVTAQLFVPPGTLTTNADGTPSGTNLHIIVAGKLFAEPGPVKPKVLSILSASASGILYAHCRAEIATLYHQLRVTGGNFHLSALPDSDNGQTLGLEFDPKEMARLFEVGYYHGIGGPAWITAPPFEHSATDAPRR